MANTPSNPQVQHLDFLGFVAFFEAHRTRFRLDKRAVLEKLIAERSHTSFKAQITEWSNLVDVNLTIGQGGIPVVDAFYLSNFHYHQAIGVKPVYEALGALSSQFDYLDRRLGDAVFSAAQFGEEAGDLTLEWRTDLKKRLIYVRLCAGGLITVQA